MARWHHWDSRGLMGQPGFDFGSGEAQLRPVSVPARGTKECGQLNLDRVSLSPEPWLGGTPKGEIMTVGPDRTRRVTL
jgi:hypothetical protein